MRVCFTSDLHGRAGLYEQLLELAERERPELLILGGDLFVDGELDDPRGTQVAFIEGTFRRFLDQLLSRSPGLAIACILGNHDWACARDALETEQRAGRIRLLDLRAPLQLDGFRLLGYSCTPPTPYWVKDFERLDLRGDAPPETGGAVWDAQLGRARQALPNEYFAAASSMDEDLATAPFVEDPWIFVCHAPPYDSQLDRLPHISEPIGSRAVRRFIEERGPLLALHGHIHESPQVTGRHAQRVGRSLCVNPGQDAARLHAVLFDSRQPEQTLRHTVYG